MDLSLEKTSLYCRYFVGSVVCGPCVSTSNNPMHRISSAGISMSSENVICWMTAVAAGVVVSKGKGGEGCVGVCGVVGGVFVGPMLG